MSIPPFTHAVNTLTRDLILHPLVDWLNSRAPGPVTVDDLVAVLGLPKPIPTVSELSFPPVETTSAKKAVSDKLSFRLVPEAGKCNHMFLANKRMGKYCPRDALPGGEFCREHSKVTPKRKDKPVSTNPLYDPRNLASANLAPPQAYANPDGAGGYVGTVTGLRYQSVDGRPTIVGKQDQAGHELPLNDQDHQLLTAAGVLPETLTQTPSVKSENQPLSVVPALATPKIPGRNPPPQMPMVPAGFIPRPVV